MIAKPQNVDPNCTCSCSSRVHRSWQSVSHMRGTRKLRQGRGGGGSRKLFYSPKYFTEDRTDHPRGQLDLTFEGSNCLFDGSVPVFLRKHFFRGSGSLPPSPCPTFRIRPCVISRFSWFGCLELCYVLSGCSGFGCLELVFIWVLWISLVWRSFSYLGALEFG